MRKAKYLGIIFGILGFLVVAIIVGLIKLVPSDTQFKTVKIANTTIKAEIADTMAKQMTGLMNKSKLPSNQGMLFIFNYKARHSIWMMNMSFPIDIIWLDENLRVTDIVENAQPCKVNCTIYYPDENALYVLEVNSGFVARNKINVGDRIGVS